MSKKGGNDNTVPAKDHNQPTAANAKGRGDKKKVAKTKKKVFSAHIYKILKKNQKDIAISTAAMANIHSFAMDMFDKISTEASRVAASADQAELSVRDLETAVSLVLPKGLAEAAKKEGRNALGRYAEASK